MIRQSKKRGRALVLFLMMGMALPVMASCAMDKDTYMNKKRVELVKSEHSRTMAMTDLDDKSLRGLVDHYQHYGEGPIEVYVTYDPESRTNTAMQATNEVARISKALRASGARELDVGVMPVAGQGADSQVLVNYRTVTARPPEGCDAMGGVDGKQTEADFNYKYGCTIETQVARQIARPRDLNGRAGLDAASARRQSNIIEPYKAAEPSEELQGETASE